MVFLHGTMGILLASFASRISQCVVSLFDTGVNAEQRGWNPFFLFFLYFKYISTAIHVYKLFLI